MAKATATTAMAMAVAMAMAMATGLILLGAAYVGVSLVPETRVAAQSRAGTPTQPVPAPAPAPAPGSGSAFTSAPRVALTFDDLPDHGPLPPGVTRVDIAKAILDALREHHAPPTFGFINAKQLEQHPEDAEVLRLWRAAGHPLGNHAFSHMDLHANSVEAFQQDVLANEPRLKTLMGGEDWHWFRYPYLHEGDTRDKQRAIAAFLKSQGYAIAEVTLSFNDYAYNEAYARCLAKQDDKGVEWLRDSYLTRAAQSLDRGRAASRAIAGRDVAHVMLLHIGGFERVMFPKLLDLLKEREFQLIPLQEAAKDPIYAIDPGHDTRTRWDGTLLEQLERPEQRPTPRPDVKDPVFEQLAALCR